MASTYYVRRRQEFGVGGENEELSKLADENPQWVHPLLELSQRYHLVADFDNATEILDRALERSSEDNRSEIIESRLRVIYRMRGIEAALNELKMFLKSENSEKVAASFVSGFAKLLYDDKHTSLSNLLREIALRKNPSLTSVRFDLAYSYGQNSFNTRSAFVNYRTLDQFDVGFNVAINNLGVLMDKIGEPALQQHFYERAIEDGNALALSNVLGILIDHNLFTRAEKLLNDNESLEGHEAEIAERKSKILQGKTDIEEKISEIHAAAFKDNRLLQQMHHDALAHWLSSDSISAIGHFEGPVGKLSLTGTEVEYDLMLGGKQSTGRVRLAGFLGNVELKISDSQSFDLTLARTSQSEMKIFISESRTRWGSARVEAFSLIEAS